MLDFLEQLFPMGNRGDKPRIEVLSHEPAEPNDRAPLLFVHGAFAGAWCWKENFLPYFAERGFSAHALSFRGHGSSDNAHWLQAASLADYVDDLAAVVEGFKRPPVLIGHSMGGMVIQKYLERDPSPAVVLMASVPPTGLGMASLRMMMGEPWLLTQLSWMQALPPALLDVGTARRAIFSDDLPDAELMRYLHRFQPESQRALWDMTVGDLPRRWLGASPRMLVLGAGCDMLFSAEMVHETAACYGLQADIVPAIAHAMMLERDWRVVAGRVADWLDAEGL